MPRERKFSVARLLTIVLDGENRPPWLPVVLTPIMLGGFFWVLTKASQPPTQAEDRRRNVQLKAQAIITDKYLNVKHEPILVIKQGMLLAKEIDWGNTFFQQVFQEKALPFPPTKSIWR